VSNTTEQFVAEILFRSEKMEAGIKQANTALESFDTKSSKVFDSYSKFAIDNLQKVNAQLDKERVEFNRFAADQAKAMAKVQQSLEKQGDVDLQGQFGDIASRGQELITSFLGASGQVEQFRLTLTTLMGSAQAADKELAKLRSYANLTPFDLASVVGAGVQLRSLKVDVDRFLPLAGDLASVFNRDIKDAANALGKALGGSQEGIEILGDSFGITKRDLKEAGAVIKAGGVISLDTAADIKKLGDAIEAVAKKKNFAGAVNTQLTTLKANASQAQDSAFNLAAAIGETLAPAFIALAQTATSTVNAVTSLPTPILALTGGATALATGLALAGGAALAFNAAMTGLGPILAKVVPALTGIQVSAAGAAVAFNPFAAAVAALIVLAGAAALAINSMEQSAKQLDAQITKESKEVASANVEFLKMRDAVAKATGAQKDFVVKGEGVASTLEKVQEALAKTSGSDFLAALEKGGIKFADLGAKAKAASDTIATLEGRKKILEDFAKVDGKLILLDPKQIKGVAKGIEREFGSVQVPLDEVRQKIGFLDRQIANVKQTSEGFLAPAVQKATPAFVLFTDAATRAAKVAADFKINGDTESLERNNELLKDAQKQITTIKSQVSQASGGKLDIGNINALQDRLTSGKTSTQEADAIKGLLVAIDVKNKLEKQGADIAEKALKPKIEAALEDARSLETARERVGALNEVLKIEGLGAQQKKAIIAEIKREEKSLDGELKTASKERVQQALFEAQQTEGTSQQKIAALQQVLDQYKLEGAERRRILNEINGLEREIEKERESRRKAEADALASENERQQQLIINALDERIAKMREEAEAGKNVGEELTAALEERTAREVALIEEKTAARASEAESSKVADQIEITGTLEVEAARRAGTDAIEEQKKAQDERIKKIREERKEALKAAKDEKSARQGVTDTIRGGSTDSAGSGPSNAGGSSAGASKFMGALLSDLKVDFDIDSVRRRTDEIRANRVTKEEERKASFETANPELVARIAEQDAKRQETLAKANEASKKRQADTVAARGKADESKQSQAQARVDSARGIDATSRTASIQGRKLTADEQAVRLAAFNLGKQPAPKGLPLPATTFGATVAAQQKAKGKTADAGSSASRSGPTSGSVTVQLEIKGQTVTAATVKKKSATLDGKITDEARIGNGFSFKVRT
jgi:hypothetical protein